tara:strand:+ start:294 stop:572 length:279 start_codon:yes stop_codon:yes gene_type:complete
VGLVKRWTSIGRRAFLDRRAVQSTDIARIVETSLVRYMREAAIVPEHDVADAPAVSVNKLVFEAMREQFFKQRVVIRIIERAQQVQTNHLGV